MGTEKRCWIEKPTLHSSINHLHFEGGISQLLSLKITPEEKWRLRSVKWMRPSQNEGSRGLHEDMELARPTSAGAFPLPNQEPKNFLRAWDLLSLSQFPEQLKEKVTGRQSFQQTEVLAREGRPPEEADSR